MNPSGAPNRGPWGPPRPGARIGPYAMQEYVDLDARGYWARVIRCTTPPGATWPADAEDTLQSWDEIDGENEPKPWRENVAVKVLRPEHVGKQDFFDAFAREATFLQALMPSRQVNPLLEFGFALSSSQDGVMQYRTEPVATVDEFNRKSGKHCAAGNVPYLVLGYLPSHWSILSITRMWVEWEGVPPTLPLLQKVDIAEQFFNFLAFAQSKGIYYLDHKPEHLYWIRGAGGQAIAMIDFNSSQAGMNDPSQVEKDCSNAFAAVAYPLFTGWALSNNPVMARIATSVDVPDLTQEGIWDASTGHVQTYHREHSVQELKDEILRLILSWGLSKDTPVNGGLSRRVTYANEICRHLGLTSAQLSASGRPSAIAAVFGAYREKLETESRLTEAIEELTLTIEMAQRILVGTRMSCEEVIASMAYSRAGALLQGELLRLHSRLELFWKNRMFP